MAIDRGILQQLKKNDPKLTTLLMNDRKLTDADMSPLATAFEGNTHVTFLNLSQNKLWEKGAECVANMLKTNKSLTVLDISSNGIRGEGVEALESALVTNTSLTELNLSDNSLGSFGTRVLARMLKSKTSITKLDVSSNQLAAAMEELVTALITNTTLRSFNVSNNMYINSAILTLVTLLETNTTLMNLDLSSNFLDGIAIRALADALKSNSSLTVLNIANNSCDNMGAEAMADMLKTNTSLTVLDLSGNKFRCEGIQSIANMLKTNTSLTVLDISSTWFGIEGAEALADMLKTNTTLKKLGLKEFNIYDVCRDRVLSLSTMLQNKTALMNLNLADNKISPQEAKFLGEVVQKNPHLTHLDLQNNQIGNDGVKALAKVVKTNTTLTMLNLDNNGITFWGKGAVKSINKVLAKNKTLAEMKKGTKSSDISAPVSSKETQNGEEKKKVPSQAASSSDGTNVKNNLPPPVESIIPVLPEDEYQAFLWRKNAAEQGDADAQYGLGLCYENGLGVKQDYNQAVVWYTKAAEQGIADAQSVLDLFCYKNEPGMKQDDYNQAVVWYTKAAEKGDPSAQYLLGFCYGNGRGVKQDDAQAFAWYQKAAEQGYVDAQYNLGFYYENGQGVKQDYNQAVVWYMKAADQGDARAQFGLGFCYKSGQGVKQDDAQAFVWYQKAAEQGDVDAQCHLGCWYENGQGVKQDYGLAMAWYQKAAAQNDDFAKERLDVLQKLGYRTLDSVNIVPVNPVSSAQNFETKQDSVAINNPVVLKPEITVPFVPVSESPSDKKDASPSSPTILSTVPHIAWKELSVGDFVGNGGYGDVYHGKWFGKEVAIKQLQLKTLSGSSAKEFIRESEIMWQCDSPHIVGLRGVCTEAGHFAMIMEFMPKGSLRQRLQDDKEFPWEKRWQLGLDIAEGLKYLHGRGILHRDLKSFNILLDANERAKISDFGLAKVKLEINTSTTKSKKTTGSVRWRAPELFKRNAVPTASSDVYSLGMILCEIVTRQLPFNDAADEQTVIAWLMQGEQEKVPEDCPQPLADIIQACFAAPDKRPSADEVVARLKQAQAECTSKESKAQEKEKSWHFDISTKPAASEVKDYVLIPASQKDIQKVVMFYQHGPVAGYDIKSVEVIYNPSLNRIFGGTLQLLQERKQSSAFSPKWKEENNNAWRGKVNAMFEQKASPYDNKDFPNVKLIPVWHGTRPDILPSLFKTGFANLATTDAGYFGKGIYSAFEAEYAYKIYSKGALLVNWVACYSAYPVIDGDMSKLTGKANYQNYDVHFVPVVPQFSDADCESFIPCKVDQPYKYTEVVVFDRSQCLPRYVVELQPSFPKAPSATIPVTDLFALKNKTPSKKTGAGNDFKLKA